MTNLAIASEMVEYLEGTLAVMRENHADPEVITKYEAKLEVAKAGNADVFGLGSGRGYDDLAGQRGHRPEGGRAHRNQYGACTIKRPSAKQTAYIAALIHKHVVSALTGRQADWVARFEAGTLNKSLASDLIDAIKSCPLALVEDSEPVEPMATDKQLAAIAREGARRIVTDEPTLRIVRLVDEGHAVTKAEASKALDVLFAAPFTPRPAATDAKIEPGVYRTADGKIYKVKLAVHGSGRPVAHLMVKLDAPVVKRGKEIQYEFVYQGLATRFVKADQRLSLEEAKQWGALYGVCMACGATLTDEREGGSIEQGIGPVCAKKAFSF